MDTALLDKQKQLSPKSDLHELVKDNKSEIGKLDKEIEELKQGVVTLENKRKLLIKRDNFYRLIQEKAKSNREYFNWVSQKTDNLLLMSCIYRSVTYEFIVSVRLREDLKKYKYEVRVFGSKEDPNEERINHSLSSRNNLYIREYYSNWNYDFERRQRVYTLKDPEMPLEKKFATLGEAKDYANEWKMKLIKDHDDEIRLENALFSQINK